MESNSFNMKWIKEGIAAAGKHWEESTDHMRPMSFRFRQLHDSNIKFSSDKKESFALACYHAEMVEMAALELLKVCEKTEKFLSGTGGAVELVIPTLNRLSKAINHAKTHIKTYDMDVKP